MKNLKSTFTLFLFLTLSLATFSQVFEIPKNYKFEKAEDYSKYEKDIIACSIWLESTPLDKDKEKRVEASKFLFMWLSGSPTVSIELYAKIVDISKKNPELLMIYMGGVARFVLENQTEKDANKIALAGLKSIIKNYKLDAGTKKDKEVQKIVDMDSKGTLEKWIADEFKK